MKLSLTHEKNTKTVEKEMIIALQKKFEKKISEHKMATDISFNELIDLWLLVHKQSVKYSTYTIRSTHSRPFKKELGKVLDRIK